jgi:zinc D-Ala-D-Ala carboxypeptidase
MPTLVGMISSTRTDIRLSPHFWLSEFELSTTATRNGLRNEASGPQIENLKRVASHGEDVRAALGNVPIVISSGLRTLIVNGLVKHLIEPADLRILDKRPDLMERLRRDPSVHMDGRAMDFTAPQFGSPRQIVARLMESPLQFDQLIFEGTWVHYGIARAGDTPRRQVLTAIFEPGKKPRYVPGLV